MTKLLTHWPEIAGVDLAPLLFRDAPAAPRPVASAWPSAPSAAQPPGGVGGESRAAARKPTAMTGVPAGAPPGAKMGSGGAEALPAAAAAAYVATIEAAAAT